MGRSKKKNIRNAVQTPVKKISNQLRNKINPLVQKLFNKCTSNVNAKKEMEEYSEIYSILQEIRQLEAEHVVPFPSRKDHWPDFCTWCCENNAEFSTISIKEISERNFGAVAEVDLKQNDLILSVPRKLMMSVDHAKSSKLGPLMPEDPILKVMPNVVLSLFLIIEYLNKDSFWQPYLSILPSSYDTVLYFDIEELKQLQRSPAQSQVINICRSVARQYAHFYQLFQNNAYASNLDVGNFFTYDLYRWAVSTVMTRQNSIPTADGNSVTTVLIPLWDMLNHANGKITTDFSVEKECLESFAMRDFSKGEEVHIFYGSRSNSEFFIHNGFVYTENENDWYPLQLNISKSDPLFASKANFCLKQGISLCGKFQLREKCIVDDELLTFLKINVLREDEVAKILENESLLQEYIEDNEEVKSRSLNFLRDRASLLLKCYKTTIEDDEKILESEENPRRRMVLQLRLCEKKLLNACINYCSKV